MIRQPKMNCTVCLANIKKGSHKKRDIIEIFPANWGGGGGPSPYTHMLLPLNVLHLSNNVLVFISSLYV